MGAPPASPSLALPSSDTTPTVPATPAAPAGTAVIPDPSIRTVQDVLDRYDLVVTGLHADPGVFLRPGDPLLAAWAAVVADGAVLADDVRSQVIDRLRRGEAIPVRSGERSYVHHVQAVTDAAPDRITFSWCGWSPGVVRDTATGAVTDDVVSHGVGTGIVEHLDGKWVLSALDETSYDVLPSGTADPCPGTGATS